MSASRATYLDASALVKLVIEETESTALRTYLRRRAPRVSSAICRTEVVRGMRSLGVIDAGQLRRARQLLSTIELVRVSDRVLDAAGAIPPVELRSLDAIHLATAESLAGDIGTFITYDERLAAAATARGMKVAQPR